MQRYDPAASHLLWEGTPSDAANLASGGRIKTAGYRLTTDALYFASGVLSGKEEVIPLWAIGDADVLQTVTQKARGVADLRLTVLPDHAQTFGQSWTVLKSIRDARRVRDLIIGQAYAVRQYWYDHQHNRDVATARAGASQVSIGQGVAPSARGDFMEQLTRLGEMKTAGLLTDAEFAAAKAKLLQA